MARKKTSLAAQNVNSTFYSGASAMFFPQQKQSKIRGCERERECRRRHGRGCSLSPRRGGGTTTYIIRVVQIQDPTPLLLDRLVATNTAVEGRIHVHVVAREIETNEALEEDGPLRVCRREEAEQACGRAAVRHHVEDGAKLCRLVEGARGVAVEGVEEAGDGVEEGAVVRVVGHEVEGGAGEDDA